MYSSRIRRGRRDCMIVGSTTTCAISVYHSHGKLYTIQLYVITFVNDLWQVGDFLRILRFPDKVLILYYNKTDTKCTFITGSSTWPTRGDVNGKSRLCSTTSFRSICRNIEETGVLAFYNGYYSYIYGCSTPTSDVEMYLYLHLIYDDDF